MRIHAINLRMITRILEKLAISSQGILRDKMQQFKKKKSKKEKNGS